MIPSEQRLHALDGLRGLAAVVVVLHHLSLLSPAVSNFYLHPELPPAPVGSLGWLLTATPIHLFVAGPEAVIVFFVISGVALVLPVLRDPAFDWVAYYPQRVLRLLVPVAASVLLAALWVVLTPQNPASAPTEWAAGASRSDLTLSPVISAVDVLFGDTSINNPLWSLRWELVFSLALPLMVVIGLATVGRLRGVATLAACLAVVLLGGVLGLQSLVYLPVFVLGVLFAVRLEQTRQSIEMLPRARTLVIGAAVLLGSLALLIAHVIARAELPGLPHLEQGARALIPLGALGLVICAVLWPPAAALLSSRLFRWLGRVSFSLYLVHVPIIIAVSALVGRGSVVLGAAISLVVAVGVAELFSRVVEVPAHRWSKSVGARASALLAR